MLRQDLADLEENGKLGDWCFLTTKTGLHIGLRYPVKNSPWPDDVRFEMDRGEMVVLPIEEGPGTASPCVWGWNGNREAPTLTPSILISQGRPDEWHGFLEDGKLRTV